MLDVALSTLLLFLWFLGMIVLMLATWTAAGALRYYLRGWKARRDFNRIFKKRHNWRGRP